MVGTLLCLPLLIALAVRAWGADRNPPPADAPKSVPLLQPASIDTVPVAAVPEKEKDAEPAPAPRLRVRVAWGGGAERRWQGRISLSTGTISDPHALGVEADEPGTMWVQDDHLEILGRSPRAYDGVDLGVTAPLNAKLVVEISEWPPLIGTERTKAATKPIEIPLADLLKDVHNSQLDDQGNRLLVRRAPGDALRVKLGRDSLVFSPGEEWSLEIQPQLPNVAAGTALHVKTTLSAARGGKVLWTKEQEVKLGPADQPVSVTQPVTIPTEEGVYDLSIEAAERGLLRWNKPLAERKVQFVVVGSVPLALPTTNRAAWTTVVELDPASPKGWNLLAVWPGFDSSRKGPLGNGHTSTWQHSLGQLVQLAPSAHGGEMSWEAYPLAISKPGTPHVLEVDVPSDVAQTLGISIMEPNAAGALLPIGLDSGVDVTDEVSSAAPHWLHHRILFWPRTKTPLVTMTNHRETTRAVYGKLRVLAGPPHLARLLADSGDTSGRMLGGYLHKPLFPQNFSASEALDVWSGRSLMDWQTFYEGGTRLIEYLHHTGQNGLMLSVLSDGSTIYPSRLLEPTPRYDTGAFFDQGQDPIRKDAFELVLRLCDREGVQCIPALQFAAPLPELETLLRQGGNESAGVRWIGADGAALNDRGETNRGLAPCYNVLDERVQAAILRVVHEAIERAAKHPSFAGLSLELNADGYAILPGEEWGFDDQTIQKFSRDMRTAVPGEGPNRFAVRAQSLTGKQRPQWLEWRANRLAAFYRNLQQEVAQAKPDAKLYLCGMNLLGGHNLQQNLRPTLPSRLKADEALRLIGLQPDLLRDTPGLMLLRPQRLPQGNALAAHAIDLEFNRAAEVDRQFSSLGPAGSLFYHEPQKSRLPSFDAKSPYGKAKTFTWQVAQISPAEQANRQRFVHALAALDAQTIFDGGWLLPLGQQESLREFAQAFRRLPAARFDGLSESSQPVAIRTHSKGGKTFIYLANDSPWPATVRVQVELPVGCTMDDLGGGKRLEPPAGGAWTVELAAYDLAAAAFSAPQLKFSHPQVTLGGNVETALDQRIRDLSARTAALAVPTPMIALSNPGFEAAVDKNGKIPGWESNVPTGAKRENDSTYKGGPAAMKLSNGKGVLTVRSEPFDPPATGRLSIAFGLRVDAVDQQPQLRLSIEGLLDGKMYYRFASVGAGRDVAKIGDRYAPYIFQVDDLPASGLTQLRVRFDLIDEGSVWIDSVQLYDLAFSDSERIELTKIITSANIALHAGKTSDCLRVLEGYWPRYLSEHVPLVQTATAPPPVKDAAGSKDSAIAKDGSPKDSSPKDGSTKDNSAKPPEKTAEKPGTWVKKVWPF